MTTRIIWLLLLGFPFGIGAGQILFKIAAQRMQPGLSLSSALDPVLIGAFGLYAALSVVWLVILKQLPLSVAYPFVAISFAVTPFLAWLILGDKPSMIYFVGIALICIGVAITQRAVYAG